jgi:sulfur carrier protein
MKITVNEEALEVEAGTLQLALNELGYGDAAVATAVNGQFVPASLRERREISEGDRIEILAPMQGG